MIPVAVDISGLPDHYAHEIEGLLGVMSNVAYRMFTDGRGDVHDYRDAVDMVRERASDSVGLPGVYRLVSSFIYNLQEDLGLSDEDVGPLPESLYYRRYRTKAQSWESVLGHTMNVGGQVIEVYEQDEGEWVVILDGLPQVTALSEEEALQKARLIADDLVRQADRDRLNEDEEDEYQYRNLCGIEEEEDLDDEALADHEQLTADELRHVTYEPPTPLTVEQLQAVRAYTDTNVCYTINRALRNGEDLDEESQWVHDELQDAFSHVQPFSGPLTVYRGITDMEPEEVLQYERTMRRAQNSDRIIHIPAYQSTSVGGFVSDEYYPVRLTITVRQGLNVIRLSGHNEREVLLNHNEAFEVQSVSWEDDGTGNNTLHVNLLQVVA
jgi:hypothetical protein